MPPSPNRIAIVHDFVRAFGGAERVLKELHELYPAAPIYTLLADPSTVSKHFPEADVRTSSLQRSWLRHRQQLLLPRLPQAVEEFDFNGYDTVISSSGAFSHGIITGPETRHICYCHSPMRYAWDWHAEYLLEHGVKSAGALATASTVMNRIRIWDYVASKRVDVWLANSETVAARIKKFYGQPSRVVYPPVDTDFFSPDDSPPPRKQPYAVTVSRLSRYKRIDMLIEACAAEGLPLVVIGDGEDAAHLRRLAHGHDVEFTGRINDETLRQYVQHADCYLSAVEEDFGISPVEALSLGVPVVALGVGGATETVEDGRTGILFGKPEAADIRAALGRRKEITAQPDAIRSSTERFSKQAFRKAIRQIVDRG